MGEEEEEEEEEDSKVNSPQPPPFLEVTCKTLGKKYRLAAGTKAGFAVSLINRKLETWSSFVSHIEAIKDGEEPISFGPDAVLVDYGNGWKLQTVTELDFGIRGVGKSKRVRLMWRLQCCSLCPAYANCSKLHTHPLVECG